MHARPSIRPVLVAAPHHCGEAHQADAITHSSTQSYSPPSGFVAPSFPEPGSPGGQAPRIAPNSNNPAIKSGDILAPHTSAAGASARPAFGEKTAETCGGLYRPSAPASNADDPAGQSHRPDARRPVSRRHPLPGAPALASATNHSCQAFRDMVRRDRARARRRRALRRALTGLFAAAAFAAALFLAVRP